MCDMIFNFTTAVTLTFIQVCIHPSSSLESRDSFKPFIIWSLSVSHSIMWNCPLSQNNKCVQVQRECPLFTSHTHKRPCPSPAALPFLSLSRYLVLSHSSSEIHHASIYVLPTLMQNRCILLFLDCSVSEAYVYRSIFKQKKNITDPKLLNV